MQPYEHGGKYYDKTIKYDLSENINPLGMPSEVKHVISSCPEAFSRYPDASYIMLRSKLAEIHGLEADNICLGNGADELIWKIMQAFKPCCVLTLAPTFSEYSRCAKSVSASVSEYVLKAEDDFRLGDDFLGCMEKAYDMIVLCNPNNPTGKLIERDLLIRILARAKEYKTTVVIDESFLDFTGEKSLANVINEYDNLIIIRGFTKIYGMAGIRLGYSISSAEIAKEIKNYGPLWNVSAVAMLAGEAALSCKDWITRTREYVQFEKKYIMANIPGVIDSCANFMLIKSREDVADKLYEQGIAVRKCHNFSGLDASYIRIGVKDHECNEAFVNAYKEIING